MPETTSTLSRRWTNSKGDDQLCRTALPLAYRFVDPEISKGNPVLVHCSAGKDRTGLFLCYFLVHRLGFSSDQAISKVREVQPKALSASGWEEFARSLLNSCFHEPGTGG